MELLEQAFGERGARHRDLLQEVGAGLALRHVSPVERPVLHVLGPVDRVLLDGLLGLLVGHLLGGLLLSQVLVLGHLVDLFEQRVLHDLLLQDRLQLEGRHLEQLERLLQALRHDQRRPLRQAERVSHLHDEPRFIG